jgi:hypothetical protein
LILTHGHNGEYGHRRHTDVHEEVLALASEGLLECEQLWCFACRADAMQKTCQAEDDVDACVELGPEKLAEKCRIITDIYGYYIAALVAAGHPRLAKRKLLALTHLVKCKREQDVEWGFNEWYRAQDGEPSGQDWQSWSAAMYLYAAACVEQGKTPFFDEIR